MVVALLLYNVATAILLAHAGLALGLSGLGLWPTIVLHAGMAAWCATCVASPGRVPRE